MPKEACIPSLFMLFRQYGYDGATLSKISEATGLGKASLYHHFPGGKDDMVESVLGYSASWLQENVLHLLASEGLAQERLQKMCDRLNDLYAGGTQPCLLAILQSGTGRDVFHSKVKESLEMWIGAIATVLTESGIEAGKARQQGEDALIAIQGALMVSQAIDDPSLFQRTLQQLPQALIQKE
jgi:AcrR family transcriptional regulator